MQRGLIAAAVVVIVVAVSVVFLVVSNRLSNSGNSIWDSVTEPKITYKAELSVNCYVSNSYWTRNSVTDLPDYVDTIACSVTNIGNSAASNVNFEIKADGNMIASRFYVSLPVAAVESYSVSITMPYDSSRNLFLYASCSDSYDSESVVVRATLPRACDENVAKLYITQFEKSVVALKNQILGEKFF